MSGYLFVLDGEMKSTNILLTLQLKDRENFRDNYLIPAMDEGYIEMTILDKPNSSKQRYRLTQKGMETKKQIIISTFNGKSLKS
jgi:hypothetical protein